MKTRTNHQQSKQFHTEYLVVFQVKRILYEEEEGSSDSSHPGSASSEDEDIFEETAQVMWANTHTRPG